MNISTGFVSQPLPEGNLQFVRFSDVAVSFSCSLSSPCSQNFDNNRKIKVFRKGTKPSSICNRFIGLFVNASRGH